ncbi:MAG TPA: 4a-hydroxytetrahydrobiopterin dehydratase [Solirubrobacteraceae bacterium]|jgi:4a-hydroxytetrahydrobiopterin dehydratase|nr:4a-hydroxytetrahydrobiopterin dehydratase [Solirubrobacteraceae bacterium]
MAVLSDQDIDARLAPTRWRRQEESIVRDFELANFERAMTLVNLVAEAAEAANHHPDILIHGYRNVRLTLSTHSEGGVTDADLDLAQRIDALA